MGLSQTEQTLLRKESIRPALCRRQPLRVPAVTLLQKTSQTTTDHPVDVLEHRPASMTKVAEPAAKAGVQARNRELQRMPLLRGDFFRIVSFSFVRLPDRG